MGLRRAIRSITFALAPSARAAARAAPTRFGGSATIPLAQGASLTDTTSLLLVASAILFIGSAILFIGKAILFIGKAILFIGSAILFIRSKILFIESVF